MHDYWTAIILGIIEGLTEFIPVSSTGHLILTGHLLSFTGPAAATFEVVIQLGAILAVVFLYQRRFLDLFPGKGWWVGRKEGPFFFGARGCLLLALTTLPALVAGKFAYPLIKDRLFHPLSVAFALAVGALALLAVERWKRPVRAASLDGITWSQAAAIGLFQCLSLWPGFSRAGATILGGMTVGLERKTAAEYSFLAAVPVMIAASGYDLYRTWSLWDKGSLMYLGIGFAVSFVTAYLTVAAFIRLLNRWTLRPFAWYRLILAPIVFFLLAGMNKVGQRPWYLV